MRFKAVLITGRRLERTAQIYAEDINKIIFWAKSILKEFPDDIVQVYERKEILTKVYKVSDFEDST